MTETSHEDLETKLGRLEARIAELEKSPKAPKVPKVIKAKRAPTDYNKFMGEAIKKIKELNPETKHADAFKQAAVEWSNAKKSAASVV